MESKKHPPKPVHIAGTHQGNEMVKTAGPEPGRHPDKKGKYRTARDATSINPEAENPIHPDMPHIPPQ